MSVTTTNWFVPSSVAREGKWCNSPPPIGLKSMQSSMFLAVWRLIFALKTKINDYSLLFYYRFPTLPMT